MSSWSQDQLQLNKHRYHNRLYFLDVDISLPYNTPGSVHISVSNVQAISELKRFNPSQGTLLTVGVFDGVHLGHKQLIDRLTHLAQERNLISSVVTFSYHPKVVLSTETRLARLTNLEERTTLLKRLGVELVVTLTFDAEFAVLSAREFVSLMQEHLKMCGLIIGPDFALGRSREGNADTLMKLGNELGFTVEVVKPLKLENYLVSSTAIRKALAQGDMRMTSKLLGRNFKLSGSVVSGTERGHIIGYPTANIKVDPDQALPGDGVYATLAYINDKIYKSATNIGIRPTFNGGERTIEVFLIDFDEDIYGRDISIELVDRLRGEEKFANTDELAAQIARDVEQTKTILS